MIKNAGWVVLAVFGCISCTASELPPGYQGVAEYDERSLAFEVPGKLTELEVAEGDLVSPGQLLARLDDSLQARVVTTRRLEAEAHGSQVDLLKAGTAGEDVRAMRARVDAAKATEKLLLKSVARETQLLAGGASTQVRLDELSANLERAQAERRGLSQQLARLTRGPRKQELQVASYRAEAAESAELLEAERLERFELFAPFEGTVLDVSLKAGELVGAGAPVITLADTSAPYAEVFVPQGQLGGIQTGTPALIRMDSLPTPLKGRVKSVARKTEFTPRYLFSEGERHNLVVRVKVEIEDPHGVLHAGLPVFVELSKGEHHASR